MGDLQGLIDAVENGDRWDNNALYRLLGVKNAERANGAFRGSLDAAKALHEVLLPGWWASLRLSTRPMVTVGHLDAVSETQDDSLARAWLLAILRALEAEGKA